MTETNLKQILYQIKDLGVLEIYVLVQEAMSELARRDKK